MTVIKTLIEGGSPIDDGAVNTPQIADLAVTFQKIQLVGSDTLLGRASAGAGLVETIPCTAAGRALLDDVDAVAQRTTLGLGTAATQPSSAFDAAGTAAAAVSAHEAAPDPHPQYLTAAEGAAAYDALGAAASAVSAHEAAPDPHPQYLTAAEGAAAYAPIGAQYIVASANGALTAERVVTDTATVTWDVATAGQLKANVPNLAVTAALLANSAVTNGKLANMATGTFKGRTSAGSGAPEDLTATQATALLDTFTSVAKGLAPASGGGTVNFLRADGTWAVPPSGGGGVTDGDKGDITVSGGGTTWTIDAAAVTFSKMQNVAQDTLLGRKTAGSGSVEECTLSEVLDFIGSAAQGDILYRSASGWVRLAAGVLGQWLRTNGAANDPAWSSQLLGITTATFNAENNAGNSGSAKTINWTLANAQRLQLTGNCTLSFTAPAGPCTLYLRLTQDATGGRTVSWPAAVKWAEGTAPTLSTAANSIDIVMFFYNGTNYFGTFARGFA